MARSKPLGCGRTGQWWPTQAIIVLGLLALFMNSGCGYTGDAARLPEGASTLGIGAVRNLTYTAELDVLLIGALRERLSLNPSLRLVSPESSQMVLEVELENFTTTRSQSLTSSTVSSVISVLKGKIDLKLRGRGNSIIKDQTITASSTLWFNQALVLTPVIRAQASRSAVDKFAEQIERRLYRDF